jgi:hypothetical protein
MIAVAGQIVMYSAMFYLRWCLVGFLDLAW